MTCCFKITLWAQHRVAYTLRAYYAYLSVRTRSGASMLGLRTLKYPVILGTAYLGVSHYQLGRWFPASSWMKRLCTTEHRLLRRNWSHAGAHSQMRAWQNWKKNYIYSEFGKREVWVGSASVVPKRNNELITQCYIWVRSASVLPKRNNGLMTHCYIWVRSASVVPKRNKRSLIHCYVWVRLTSIVPELHVCVS